MTDSRHGPGGKTRRVRLALVCALLAGCRSHTTSVKPNIEVTRIPIASTGGPDQMDEIEGKVHGARGNQQIVLYAHSGVWWVQPFVNEQFTKIQSDSTWKSFTHLGTEYAVVLVDSGYRPASKTVALPVEGNGVVAVAVVRGRAGTPGISRVVHFSGYDWIVRSTESDHGGEPNAYDPDNVWTDEKGYLHLRMAKRNGHWTCAEVNLNRNLGYGTYRFVVHDTAHLRPSAVLGLFTWDDMHSEGFHNELDIELSRWGDAKGKNVQYVVQPFYVPENFYRFTAPAGPVTYQLRWEAGRATFTTFAGNSANSGAKPIGGHLFTSGIPTPAYETVRIDLYDFHHAENPSQIPTEAVIERFDYSH
jgi:hypothetical protein